MRGQPRAAHLRILPDPPQESPPPSQALPPASSSVSPWPAPPVPASPLMCTACVPRVRPRSRSRPCWQPQPLDAGTRVLTGPALRVEESVLSSFSLQPSGRAERVLPADGTVLGLPRTFQLVAGVVTLQCEGKLCRPRGSRSHFVPCPEDSCPLWTRPFMPLPRVLADRATGLPCLRGRVQSSQEQTAPPGLLPHFLLAAGVRRRGARGPLHAPPGRGRRTF